MSGRRVCHRLRIVAATALLTIAAGRAIWLSFTAYAIADRAASGDAALTAVLQTRYAVVRPALGDISRIGYRAGDGKAMGSVAYLMARLTLLPTVVTPEPTESLTLYDARDEVQLKAWLAETGDIARQRFGDGLALVEVRRK